MGDSNSFGEVLFDPGSWVTSGGGAGAGTWKRGVDRAGAGCDRRGSAEDAETEPAG